MTVRARFAASCRFSNMTVAFLVVCLSVSTVLVSAGSARAECAIDNQDRAMTWIGYQAASSVCLLFKKEMEDTSLWALLQGSQAVTGISAALGESQDAANAFMRVVMPMVARETD